MPLNIDFQQICLHLLNFAILFTGLYLILYKPVKDFMNKRQEHYKDMEKKADDNKAEAEELKKSYEEKLASVDEEISAKKRSADAEVSSLRKEQIEKAEAEAEKIVKDAKDKAKRESDRIIHEADKEAKNIVADAAEQLVKGSLSDNYDAFLKATHKE